MARAYREERSMKLSLSTAAAPELALGALDEAVSARGLDGIELTINATDDLASLAATVRTSGARIIALRVETFNKGHADKLARLSAELGVPVSTPPGAVASEEIASLEQVFAAAGGTLLLGFGTDLTEAIAVMAALTKAGDPLSMALSWDLRPSVDELSAAGAILLTARRQLRVVRMHGGGPEQHQQDGRGVGPLLVDLAISGYGGPIVLTPSAPSELPRWRDWLASRKATGCGSAHPSGALEVDVRDVEPRDRLGTILGAYRALPLGATLHITLDHDPSCMYYALEASEPEGSFAFRKIGDGPIDWHAEVTRNGPGAAAG